MLHGLPLGYSKDMQEDKEALFDAADTIELCLEAAAGLLRGLSFDRERLAEAAARRVGGRDRGRRPAGAARDAVPRGARRRRRSRPPRARRRAAALSDIERDELASFSELLDDEYYEVLSTESALDAKRSAGGTAPAAVADQLSRGRAALAETSA